MLPKGYGSIQVPERINDNAYKIDLLSEYNVNATFNVTDLSPFDVDDDLRTNPFQDEGNDGGVAREWSSNLLKILLRPMAQAKIFKEALNILIQDAQVEEAQCSTPKKKQRWSTSSKLIQT